MVVKKREEALHAKKRKPTKLKQERIDIGTQWGEGVC